MQHAPLGRDGGQDGAAERHHHYSVVISACMKVAMAACSWPRDLDGREDSAAEHHHLQSRDRTPSRPTQRSVHLCTFNRPVWCCDCPATGLVKPWKLAHLVYSSRGNRPLRQLQCPHCPSQLQCQHCPSAAEASSQSHDCDQPWSRRDLHVHICSSHEGSPCYTAAAAWALALTAEGRARSQESSQTLCSLSCETVS